MAIGARESALAFKCRFRVNLPTIRMATRAEIVFEKKDRKGEYGRRVAARSPTLGGDRRPSGRRCR